MVADIQYALYRSEQGLQHLDDEPVDSLPLSECYMFGKSTSNQRIENFWNRMLVSQTRVWWVSNKAFLVDNIDVEVNTLLGLFSLFNSRGFPRR